MDANTLTLTKDLIEKYEGRRHLASAGTEPHPVVGVGFNLDRPDAREKIEALGLDFGAVRSGHIALSNAQIDALLDGDVHHAAAAARRQLADFDDLPADRQAAAADMMFNLGTAGFSEFHQMVGSIENGEFEVTAASAIDRPIVLDEDS